MNSGTGSMMMMRQTLEGKGKRGFGAKKLGMVMMIRINFILKCQLI